MLKNLNFDPENAKFLDKNAKNTVTSMGQKVSLSTYPRSGNSFIRKYLQLITGVTTGSDLILSICVDLQMNNFIGEEIFDDSVWITKSHDP